MDDIPRKPPPATELIRLRTVVTYVLETIERVIPGVEQLAGVYALRDAGYDRLLLELQAARVALLPC
jgi:hypothetical protein